MINWSTQSPFTLWQSLSARPVAGIHAVRLSLRQYWLADAPLLELVAVFDVTVTQCRVAIVCRPELDILLAQWPSLSVSQSTIFFQSLLNASGAAAIDPAAAQLLQPVNIPKPWGQEIWYTGIEARGVAAITDGCGVTPLPWLLAAFPELYGDAAPVLLKILDPYADELLGDLYFELHQEKREVYVVTAIDRQAWPQGRGAIRFGFDQAVRAEYADDPAFVAAYLQAVADYEVIRRQIDALLDGLRAAHNLSPADPASPATLRGWMAELDPQLVAAELAARQRMNRFTRLKPLQLGDIVKVPTLLPHSLQHGVRTVEFQTPVYERMILSFAQKVLTQSHWDTREAAALMTLDEPVEPPPQLLAEGTGWRCEQVVEFDDFAVERWSLEPGAAMQLPADPRYRLLMVVQGAITLGTQLIGSEQAALLPATFAVANLHNTSRERWIFLLAKPLDPPQV